jgi:hypothetical protein
MGKTTTTMIADIKLIGSFPTTDSLFSNANYLSILTREQLTTVVPLLNKVNEEYFITEKDYAVTANQISYRIPARAVGSQLRDVQLVSSSGDVTGLVRLFEDNRESSNEGQQGYYIKGNSVLLSPTPTTTTGDTLRLIYMRRPSTFVLPSACGEITSINTGTNQVVVSALPSTMTTSTSIDFIQGSSPYDLLSMDTSISSVSGTTVNFSALPTDLAVGDYICLSGQACVPMIPEELVDVLIQAALCTCLSSKKDKSVELELQKLEQLKNSFIEMLSPRVKSDDKKILNKYSFF